MVPSSAINISTCISSSATIDSFVAYSKGIELHQEAYSMDDLENMELNNVVGNAEEDESWIGLMTSGLGDKYDLQKFCKTEEFENRGPEL